MQTMDLSRTEQRIDDLGRKVDDLRAEMQSEFKAVRAEIRSEFRAVRAEMRDEFKVVRGEIRDEFRVVRSEFKAELGEQRSEIVAMREAMETRFDAFGARFDSIQRSMLWMMGTVLVVIVSILVSAQL